MDNSKPLPVMQKPWWLGRGNSRRPGRIRDDDEAGGIIHRHERDEARETWEWLHRHGYVE